MAEFTHIGKHCTSCNQLDFLPIKCGKGCEQYFCKTCASSHLCKEFMSEEDFIATLSISIKTKSDSPKKKCGVRKCKTYVTLMYCECKYCGKRTCFEHKDYHAMKCKERQESNEAEKRKAIDELHAKNYRICEKMVKFCRDIIPILKEYEQKYERLSNEEYEEGWEVKSKRTALKNYQQSSRKLTDRSMKIKQEIEDLEKMLEDAEANIPDDVAKQIEENATYKNCKRHLDNSEGFSDSYREKIICAMEKIKANILDMWMDRIKQSIKSKHQDVVRLDKQVQKYYHESFEIKLQLETLVASDINAYTERISNYKKYVVEIRESYSVFEKGVQMLTENGDLKVINSLQQFNYITKLTSSVSDEVNRIIEPYIRDIK